MHKPPINHPVTSGIVLLHKPSGMTSNQALQRVKRIFRASKAGHTGSLDPLASGLLPICLGEATKISSFLLDADKVYVTEARLGIETDSGDADGEVVRTRAVAELAPSDIESVLSRFRGEIRQVPPMHSALKRDGQPLYKLARRGISVEREARAVTIHTLSMDAMDKTSLWLSVRCSKGTYIRTLVQDIGEALGCGAHVAMLRRTGVGLFQLAQAHTLEALQVLAGQGGSALERTLIPIDQAMSHWPRVILDAERARRFVHGQAVALEVTPAASVVLVCDERRSLGLGEWLVDQRLAPKRLFHWEGQD